MPIADHNLELTVDVVYLWVRSRGHRFRPWTYGQDGLNSLQYKLVNVTRLSLYVNISVILPPPAAWPVELTSEIYERLRIPCKNLN